MNGTKNLKFQHKWLSWREWLVYSKLHNSAYCKYCVLFPPNGVDKQELSTGKLISESFNRRKHALEVFDNHEKAMYHNNCKQDAQNFVAVHTNVRNPINIDLNKALEMEMKTNRESLAYHKDCAVLRAARGHRDNGRLSPDVNSPGNEGNFREMLRFREDSGDLVLSNYLNNSSSNATYIIWRTQNEILSSCGKIITSKVFEQVNSAKFFGILCDETPDIATKEQMSLCVRYFDINEKTPKEDLLMFVRVNDVTGKGLSNVILKSLHEKGVCTEFLRGQGYDGASAISGVTNGELKHIGCIPPTALYVQCRYHALNLSVCDACSVPSIRNFTSTILKVYDFFNTPKRQAVLH
ncbi:hypothetical protein PR048_030928 [Dryococelus australis]|uniref:DUF4371 domain-containing protein n=1 Tax=Dryococelus australis TaxID=614101 RepID=A0ABQ9GD33_9NEOP|nr:hypothetical protein PR048_030928 [Dryococelus australis]